MTFSLNRITQILSLKPEVRSTTRPRWPISPIKTLIWCLEARKRDLVISRHERPHPLRLFVDVRIRLSSWLTGKDVGANFISIRTYTYSLVGSTNANDALEISMVQAAPLSPKTLSSFHPQFTYPIFGEEESIFGYQGLKLNLRFAAHNLRPNLEVLYDKKFKTVGDTKATDIQETLKEWTPEGEEILKRSDGKCG